MNILKYFLIFILLIFSSNAMNAHQTVYLEDVKEENLFSSEQNEYSQNALCVYKLKVEENKISPQKNYDYYNLYSSKKFSQKKEVKFDDFTLGLKSDNTILPNQYTSTKTLFTQYQWDNFSLQSSYINNPMTMIHNKGKGSLSFSPEYRFNKYFALKTNHLKNFLDKSRKNEILLNVKPLPTKDLDFNIGAGHVQPDSGKKPSTQFRFSTDYKF